MKKTYLAALLFPVLALLVSLMLAQSVDAQTQTFVLSFIPTQNAPLGTCGITASDSCAEAVLTIQVANSQTIAKLNLTGLYPNTVYTLWTVFNVLECANCNTSGPEVPSSSATLRPGFPAQGNGVSPTAPLGSGFTSGMGLDPGFTVVTDAKGNGNATVQLDFDLVWNAPVSNRDIILQCAPANPSTPGVAVGLDAITGKPTCPEGLKVVRVTTTWLRRFIGEFPLDQRAAKCVNYNAQFDQDRPDYYDITVARGTNAAWWQCVDPASGLPLVSMFRFNHFRLANHPDDLSHGFIGGDGSDHWIDMVGRRCDMIPYPDPLPDGESPSCTN